MNAIETAMLTTLGGLLLAPHCTHPLFELVGYVLLLVGMALVTGFALYFLVDTWRQGNGWRDTLDGDDAYEATLRALRAQR